MATTVTPGSTAALESETVPLICAVAWAHAVVAARRRTVPTRTPHVRFIQLPPLTKVTNAAETDENWPYRNELRGSIHPLSFWPTLLFPADDGQIREGVPRVVDTNQDKGKDCDTDRKKRGQGCSAEEERGDDNGGVGRDGQYGVPQPVFEHRLIDGLTSCSVNHVQGI